MRKQLLFKAVIVVLMAGLLFGLLALFRSSGVEFSLSGVEAAVWALGAVVLLVLVLRLSFRR